MYFFVGGGVGIKGTDVWPSLSPHRAPAESGEAASRAPQWQGAPRAGTVLHVSQGGLAGVLTSPRRDEGRSRPEATLSTPCSVRAGGFEPQGKDFSGKPRDGGLHHAPRAAHAGPAATRGLLRSKSGGGVPTAELPLRGPHAA